MKISALSSLCLLCAAAACLPSPLAAQASPVSEVFRLPSWKSPESEPYALSLPSAAPLAGGGFVVVREGRDPAGTSSWDEFTACGALLLGPSGAIGPRVEIQRGHDLADTGPDWPVVAPHPDGGFVTAWSALSYATSPLFLQRFTRDGRPWTEEPWVIQGEVEGVCTDAPEIAANAKGEMAVAWEHSDCGFRERRIAIQLFGAAGRPLAPRILIEPEDPARFNNPELPRIGIDHLGRVVALWREAPKEGGPAALRAQRFDRQGAPLGPRLTIGETSRESALAVTPSGSFLAAWDRFETFTGWAVRLQWHTAAGAPEGAPLDLPALGASLVALAADRHGNLALLRRDGPESLLLELFDRDLVRQGAPLRIGKPLVVPDWLPPDASVALSDTGRLLTVWSHGAKARVWQARHDADACVHRGNAFLCDLAGDGIAPGKQISFGTGTPREVPFLADWNGDGRADPCLWRGGRFLCDTAHDGGLAEARSPVLGSGEDQPLLGDLDGDGRVDPCVRRGSDLLCDRARDGGSKDLRLTFGTPGDLVVLGDPDGDGRDEPCLVRKARLLCDTAHDGGSAEVRLDLMRLGGTGTPVLGDLDGDGRDDACLFTGDRFLCGIYPAAGGLPQTIFEVPFGQPGDHPLLGDLDAF